MGSFGTVFKANLNGNIVAWKKLTSGRMESKMWLEEFKNQAILDHDNIVKVYGWTKEIKGNKIIYGIVMEKMNNGDLEGMSLNIIIIIIKYLC